MNTGFRQYKLPNNITNNQNIEINDDKYLKEDSKMFYALDGDDVTQCVLYQPQGESLKDAEIVITFDKIYNCDYVQLICNTAIDTVDIYDYSNNEKGILLLTQEDGQEKQVSQIVQIPLSAILITNLSPVEGDEIEIKAINAFNNEIEPPSGFYFREIEIQSNTKEEEE